MQIKFMDLSDSQLCSARTTDASTQVEPTSFDWAVAAPGRRFQHPASLIHLAVVRPPANSGDVPVREPSCPRRRSPVKLLRLGHTTVDWCGHGYARRLVHRLRSSEMSRLVAVEQQGVYEEFRKYFGLPAFSESVDFKRDFKGLSLSFNF